jgi:hypothetical protein
MFLDLPGEGRGVGLASGQTYEANVKCSFCGGLSEAILSYTAYRQAAGQQQREALSALHSGGPMGYGRLQKLRSDADRDSLRPDAARVLCFVHSS